MSQQELPKILMATLGMLSQNKESGILVLEQNDGFRRMEWCGGSIVYLQSDVAGEQTGSFLLRQGVIDFNVLCQLLQENTAGRFCDKIVRLGLMTAEDRDRHLQALVQSVMVNVLEHPVVKMDWVPEWRGEPGGFRLPVGHKQFIWDSFNLANIGDHLCDVLYDDPEWRWVCRGNLLEGLSDLPLTPQMAYSLSFLGPEPVGFETFLSLCGMEEETGAKLFGVLWSLGLVELVKGKMPSFKVTAQDVGFAPSKQNAPDKMLGQAIAAPRVEPVIPPPQPIPSAQEKPTQEKLTQTLGAEPLNALSLDFDPCSEMDKSPLEDLKAPELQLPEIEELPDPAAANVDRAKKLCSKAKALVLQERIGEAIKLLEQSVKLYGDSSQAFDAWLLLGRLRMSNPAWSNRAIEALQAASRTKPTSAEPWAMMGEIYQRKGFAENAMACFKKALEIDPSVQIPADVRISEEARPEEQKANKGLLDRFRAMLGGK